MNDVVRLMYARLPAPLRSVAATLHGARVSMWRFGPETERLVEDALEREHWTPERLRAWQEERLARVLHRAATDVPYYRTQWQRRRQRGDTAGWEYLENWAVLEKEDVRADPRAFVADDCNPRRMLHEVTSGTTGKPLDLWRRRDTMRAFYALSIARSRGWHGATPADRWAMLGGQVVVPVEQRRPPFWVWNRAMHQLYMSTFHLAPDLVPHYLDALVRYRVSYMFGYTSSVLPLAQEALACGRTDVRLKVVITNAEPLTQEARETIGRAFGCPVRETYGAGELVTAASECLAGRLHLWPEVGWTEVHDEGVPVGPGKLGELICTGLINADMPFIRYRVGDVGRLAAEHVTCSCRRTLPQLDCVAGRINDVLLTRDGRRVWYVGSIFYGLPVRHGQIVQETIDRIRIRYTSAPGFSEATRSAMTERLRARMGDFEIVFEPVEELPRTRAGKIQAVICQIAPEERDAVLNARREGCHASC